MKQMLTSLLKDEDGATLIVVAAGIVAVVAVIGLALDMSNYARTKSQFRNAVDQAALATASSSVGMSSSVMNQFAREYVEANFTQLENGARIKDVRVSYDRANARWTTTASADMPTSFSTMIGMNNLTFSHTAAVQWDEVTTEVVFAVDISASMCATFDDAARDKGVLKVIPDPQCTKLKYVRDALTYLIAGDGKTWNGLPAVTTQSGQAAYKIGIVPFNHKVKFPDLNKIPSVLTSSEIADGDENYFKQFVSDPGAAETPEFPLPQLTPLVELRNATDRNKLKSAIAALNTSHVVPGWTRSNLGLMTAALMLDPAYHRSFAGAVPAEPATPRNEKVVFLLTDGANMGCCFSDHPTGTYQQQYLYTYRTDNLHMSGPEGAPEKGLCGALKTQGYKVFTLVYDVQDADARGSGKVIKKILSDCATGPEGENYFDLQLNEGGKIADAYQQIAQSLMRLRLAY